MGKVSGFLRDLFFMPQCYVCGKEPDDNEDGCLCRICRDRYLRERKVECAICHKRYDFCTCRPRFASPYIENYVKVLRYREESAAGRILLTAKDLPNAGLNRFIAGEMAEVICKRGIKADLVTFIPCSDASFCKKGFDHGEELAKMLAKQLKIPWASCFKVSAGSQQKQLSAEERLTNSRNSITPNRKIKDRVEGKRVLLVDDILTTGASALVSSVYLNDNGASSVVFVSYGSK
ncbi:MAG: ComF family protein [Ruminococcaceae bacterium]|nr:ComF family protein [Oscillospiraceae bacterium]